MDLSTLLLQAEDQIRDLFRWEKSGHDLHHLKRVLNNALTLQEKEGGDRLVIAISALLHDVHRIIQNETGAFCSPRDSIPQIQEILSALPLTPEQREGICHCIEYHEEYDFYEEGKTAQDLETLILQDADNLDAIWAIWIGRTFAFSGAHGVPMWQPDVPLDREYFDESELDPSTIHHFHSKLLKLKENMNTQTGKRMAQERDTFMQTFLQEFSAEWSWEK